MIGYVVKRILIGGVTFFIVTLFIFFLKQIVPGDPVMTYLGISESNTKSIDVTTYNQAIKTLKMDLPLFYCSFQPSYFPSEFATKNYQLNELEKKMHRLYKHKMLVQKFISNCQELNSGLSNDFFNNPIPSALQKSDSVQFSQLHPQIVKLQDFPRTKSFDFPNIIWNGRSNQYHQWLIGGEHHNGVVKGNFGISLVDGLTIQSKMMSAIRWTSYLGLIALIITLFISLPLGVFMGYFEQNRLLQFFSKLNLFVYAIPTFWLSMLALSFLCNPDFIKIFPPGAAFMDLEPESSVFTNFSKNTYYLILPALCWSASIVAYLAVQIKDATIQIKKKPYFKAAVARGLNKKAIVLRHLLFNASPILMALLPRVFIIFFTGSVIVESIFSVPGLGKLFFTSIVARDFPAIFGITTLIIFFNLLLTLLADIFMAYVDPRIKLNHGS
ncbi:MAG: ABC transporter permease [Flavobacteriales bacterium]|nr:ABC transporter permease [Flavobacteriales bacterium]